VLHNVGLVQNLTEGGPFKCDRNPLWVHLVNKIRKGAAVAFYVAASLNWKIRHAWMYVQASMEGTWMCLWDSVILCRV